MNTAPTDTSARSAKKFDLEVNPVYQIDFQNIAAGKMIAATKRRVRFRFGFSSAEACAQGLTGTDCRGEEHEVSIVWSLYSGKRLVLFDTQEVHFSVGNHSDKFETTWSIPGGHIMQLVAHAAAPLFQTPGFRQFDLLLDGLSFFSMPHIYELGRKSNKSRSAPLAAVASSPSRMASPSSSSARTLPLEADRSVNSPQPARAASSPNVMLMDMLDDQPKTDYLDTSFTTRPLIDEFTPVPATTRQKPSFELATNQIMSAYATPSVAPPAVTLLALANEPYIGSAADSSYYQVPSPMVTATPPKQTQQGFYQQAVPSTPYAPQTQQGVYRQAGPSTPYAQQLPRYQPVTNPYYSQQQQQPFAVSPAGKQHFSAGTASYGNRQQEPAVVSPEQPASYGSATVRPTMQPLNLQELEAREQPPMSDVERAMRNLVNLDDISEQVESPERIKKQQLKKQNVGKTSKPLPPTKADWSVGANASLGDIHNRAQNKAAPAKEIMRGQAFDPNAVHAGMLVVYEPNVASSVQGLGPGVQQVYYQQQQGMQPGPHRPYYPQQSQPQQPYAMSRAY